jgi:thiosulfate reductase cytochrome b subunit
MVGAAQTSARREAAATGPVVKRHNIAVRLTHWVTALAMLVLVMSGLAIFNAAPYLDASDKNDPAHRILAIGAETPAATSSLFGGAASSSAPVGTTTIFGHRFVTTGWLGIADDGSGSGQQAQRAFPGWITFPGYQDLASSRQWHFFFGWTLLGAGLIYAISGLVKKDLRLIILRPSDLPKMWPMQAYYLRLRKEPPDHGKYNPLQKAGYTALLFGLVPFLIITGAALSPGIDAISGPLTTLLGGRQFARTWHFIAMLALIAFTFGHVFLVISTGFINNMRAMILGTYRLGKHEGTGP